MKKQTGKFFFFVDAKILVECNRLFFGGEKLLIHSKRWRDARW